MPSAPRTFADITFMEKTKGLIHGTQDTALKHGLLRCTTQHCWPETKESARHANFHALASWDHQRHSDKDQAPTPKRPPQTSV